MAHFIVIFGPPASGKTKFIEHLEHELQLAIPIFSKDIIKEIIFETVGVGDIVLSKKEGAAAWDIMTMSLEQLAKDANGMYVIEGNFRQHHRDLFERLEKERGATFDQILFTAEPEAIEERFRSRLNSGERHPGHSDGMRPITNDVIVQAIKEEGVFANVEGRRVTIDTTDLASVDYRFATEMIKTRLEA